jgi:hypothetical protein
VEEAAVPSIDRRSCSRMDASASSSRRNCLVACSRCSCDWRTTASSWLPSCTIPWTMPVGGEQCRQRPAAAGLEVVGGCLGQVGEMWMGDRGSESGDVGYWGRRAAVLRIGRRVETGDARDHGGGGRAVLGLMVVVVVVVIVVVAELRCGVRGAGALNDGEGGTSAGSGQELEAAVVIHRTDVGARGRQGCARGMQIEIRHQAARHVPSLLCIRRWRNGGRRTGRDDRGAGRRREVGVKGDVPAGRGKMLVVAGG